MRLESRGPDRVIPSREQAEDGIFGDTCAGDEFKQGGRAGRFAMAAMEVKRCCLLGIGCWGGLRNTRPRCSGDPACGRQASASVCAIARVTICGSMGGRAGTTVSCPCISAVPMRRCLK